MIVKQGGKSHVLKGFERRLRKALSRLDGAERHLLDEIDAAQARLAAGTYGACERCGTAIPGARLRALPTARLCIGCGRVAERAERA